MEIIKVIEMEGMRSRTASVWPSYKDDNVIYFDEESIEERDGENPSNYGLLPLDLVFKMGSRSDVYDFLKKGNESSYNSALGANEYESKNIRLSFGRVQEIYSFFTNYRHMLSGGSSCDLTYSSTTEYYNKEDSSISDAPKHRFETELKFIEDIQSIYLMPSGDTSESIEDWQPLPLNNTLSKNKRYYEDLEKTYNNLGGDKFYNWLSTNVFPSFEIPMVYRDAWNRERLYLPDVRSWMGWFSERSSYPSSGNCNQSNDCCDCEKYWRLGGSTILRSMKSWYNSVQNRIDRINSIVKGNLDSFTPHILLQHRMVSNVFDLGNESILYEEYNPRDWYYSGNVISVSGESMILTRSTNGGHKFDDIYLENHPDNDSWDFYDNEGCLASSKTETNHIVSGTTVSRLLDLRSTELLTDDIGNTLEGTYDVSDSRNHQPQENETLGLMYKVGNVANLYRTTDEDGHEWVVGDIITSMTFYIIDISGGTHTVSNMQNFSGESVYCDVVYCVGATLDIDNRGKFTIKSGLNSGVTYSETVMFVKTKRDYYLKERNEKSTVMGENIPIEHSISYPIYVWELRQNVKTVLWSNYNDYDAKIASFSAKVKSSDDMVVRNNTDSYPTFREEYNIGISSYQNVDADIYIDRGINSAFELHLKLGEVSSLDALLKYGNNYFAIMED